MSVRKAGSKRRGGGSGRREPPVPHVARYLAALPGPVRAGSVCGIAVLQMSFLRIIWVALTSMYKGGMLMLRTASAVERR